MKTFERGTKRLRSEETIGLEINQSDDKWEMACSEEEEPMQDQLRDQLRDQPPAPSPESNIGEKILPKRGSGRLSSMQSEDPPLPKKPTATKTSPPSAVRPRSVPIASISDSLNSSQPQPHDISDSESPSFLPPHPLTGKARKQDVADIDEIFETATNRQLDSSVNITLGPIASKEESAPQFFDNQTPLEPSPPASSTDAEKASSSQQPSPLQTNASPSLPNGAKIEDAPPSSLPKLPPTALSMFGRSQAVRHQQPHLIEPSPAQTIAEAQERGEQQQIQDDASYALDGLSPTASLSTQRESISKLAELLSTRRGRAALRPDGLSQQILTAAAKLRGSYDPSLALSCSSILYSLSSKDSHPSFLASSAAAVLIAQLLQCTEHDLSPHLSASTPFKLSCSHTADDRATATRALSVLIDGQMGKKLASDLLPHPSPASNEMLSDYEGSFPSVVLGSHLPLVLLAVQSATSTEASTLKFTDRVKGNLFKVKALDHLAAVVGRKCANLQDIFSERPGDKTADELEIDPAQTKAPLSDVQPIPQLQIDVPSAPAPEIAMSESEAVKSDPWDLPGSEQEDEEDPIMSDFDLKGSQVQLDDKLDEKEQEPQAVSEEEEPDEPVEVTKPPTYDLYWKARRQLSELKVCLSVVENATFTCKENEEEMLKIVVKGKEKPSVPSFESHVSVEVAGDDKMEEGGDGEDLEPGRGFVYILVDTLRLLSPHLLSSASLSSASPSDGCCSSASILHNPDIDPSHQYLYDLEACIHSGLGVLMNLTHEHEEGVQACIEAGALQAAAEILRFCSHKENEDGPDREAMLKKLDLVTVASGLLINLVSDSFVNREMLRQSNMVRLLCKIFTIMASAPAPAKTEIDMRSNSAPRKKRSVDPSEIEEDLFLAPAEDHEDHDEVTAEDLQGQHQEGEAAIIQAYSAMLLGFLIVDSSEAREEARQELKDGDGGDGLALVAAAVKRCLEFYTMTGAITERCSSALTGLLSGLNKATETNE